MLSSSSQPGQLIFAGFAGAEVPDDLARLISTGRVGGVVLFARNIEHPQQVRELVRTLHELAPSDAPLCVSIDQEGGRVQRLRSPWTEFPPMRRVGENDDLADTSAIGSALARELCDLGVDLDFAPSCDVDSNPDNPVIGDRSFGRGPEQVGRHAAAFIRGLQSVGVAGCAKHFPGHGDTHTDSHLTLPRLDPSLDRLQRIEFPPFREAILAEVACIMTAHVILESIDPELPATLSQAVLRLLRDDLGYDGLVVTDDLEMRAIADNFSPTEIVERASQAGVDAFLVCSNPNLREEILTALERQPKPALTRSLDRMLQFKKKWIAARPPSHVPGTPPYTSHQELAARLDDRTQRT